MNAALFYAVLSVAYAAIGDDLHAVSSDAEVLRSLVNDWSSGNGLQGALVIQQSYAPLSSAVQALGSSAGSVSTGDVASAESDIVGLTSSVTGLLQALTNKASDFSSVGAASIVTGDINGLSSTSAQIISDLVKAANGGVGQKLADGANGLAAAFSTAISAFSANGVEFPSVTAGDATAASSSEAATSEGASSEAASSAASATVAPTAASNGTNGTVVVEQTVVETVCTKEACTGVQSANGAIRNGAALGVVGVVAAALL